MYIRDFQPTIEYVIAHTYIVTQYLVHQEFIFYNC